MKEKKFSFEIPVNIKKGEDGVMKVSGIASTEHKDLQDEIVKLHGLDISELQAGNGIFNDDHKRGIENVVGIIEDAKITSDGLFVKGELFDDEKGRKYYNIMNYCEKNNKEPRVGMSIEGIISKRDGDDGKIIAAAKIDKVALTLNPVNKNTYATLLKSLEAQEDLLKLLGDDEEAEKTEKAKKISEAEIPNKIKKLRDEGYPQKQAIAIAHQMAGKVQKGNDAIADVSKAEKPALNKEELEEVFNLRFKQWLKWAVTGGSERGLSGDELKEHVCENIYEDLMSSIMYDENMLKAKRLLKMDYKALSAKINKMDLDKLANEIKAKEQNYVSSMGLLRLSQKAALKAEEIMKGRGPDKQPRKRRNLGSHRLGDSTKFTVGDLESIGIENKYKTHPTHKQRAMMIEEGIKQGKLKKERKLVGEGKGAEFYTHITHINKSLSIGDSNYANTLPGSMEGGTTLSKESLERKKKKVKKVVKGILEKHPELTKNLGSLIEKVSNKLT